MVHLAGFQSSTSRPLPVSATVHIESPRFSFTLLALNTCRCLVDHMARRCKSEARALLSTLTFPTPQAHTTVYLHSQQVERSLQSPGPRRRTCLTFPGEEIVCVLSPEPLAIVRSFYLLPHRAPL